MALVARRTRREPPHGWVTPTTAARKLRLALSSVYRLIDQGELPAYRYSDRLIRIRADDLANFQRQRQS